MTTLKVEIDDNILSISSIETVLGKKGINATTQEKEKIQEILGKVNTLRKDLLVLTLASSTDEQVGEIKFNTMEDLYTYLDELFSQTPSLVVDKLEIYFSEPVAVIKTEYVNLYCGYENGTTLLKVARKIEEDEETVRVNTVATLFTENSDWDTVLRSMKSLAFKYRSQL